MEREVRWRRARVDVNGESDARGCIASQRRSDPVRGSEGVDGIGGTGVLNSGSVNGTETEGDEEEEDEDVGRSGFCISS